MSDLLSTTKKKEKKKDNFETILSECRAAIPSGDTLSDREILAQFSPEYLYRAASYGSVNCICGHPIKYVWGVRLKSNPAVIIEPIGSECIKRFVGARLVNRMTSLYDALWTMWERLKAHCSYNGQYTLDEEFVCADNGFTALSIEFLEFHGLEPEKAQYLRKLFRRKDVREQSPRQRWFSHYTVKQIAEVLHRELKEV